MKGLNKVKVYGLEKMVRIVAALLEEEANALSMLLVEFKDLFSWKSIDMPGITKELIAHELNIDRSIRSINQK